MKKICKKFGMVKSIGYCLGIVGLLLAIIGIFIKSADATLIMDIIGCLLIMVGAFMIVLKAEKNRLLKMIFAFAVIAILMTWILPYGYFQASDYYDYGLQRVGFADLSVALYYAFNFALDKILFLFVLAGFYSVIIKTNGYKKLVTCLANKLKDHKKLSAFVISFIVVVLTVFLKQTFIVLLFIPFFISVLYNMNVDKMTTFAVTFGSILVGIIAAVFGTESLTGFNQYLGTEVSVGVYHRLIILVVAFALYSCILLLRMNKAKGTKKEELIDDPFLVEAPKKTGGSTVANVFTYILLGLLVVITIMGYVAWNANWGIECFDKFHEWLTGIAINKDFAIFSYILGKNAVAFGLFDLFSITIVMLIVSAIIALINHIKFDEYFEAFFDGMKKMVKPIAAIVGVYVIFVIVYMSPFTMSIDNWLLTKHFNPYTAALAGFITSIFHVDFGYTAYVMGSYLTTTYASDIDIVHTIFVTMYGLVQLFMPTSLVLVLGLSLNKIDYKDWLKYIWLFIIGLLIVLLVFFTVVTYI